MQTYNIWIAGSAFGTRQNRRFTYQGKINLHSGTNRIALLSVAVGLPVSSLFSLPCKRCFSFFSYPDPFPLFRFWRMWVDTLSHGILESWVRWHCMGWVKGKEICHGRNGHTRCFIYPIFSRNLSSVLCIKFSIFIRWGLKVKLWILHFQPTLPLLDGWMRP